MNVLLHCTFIFCTASSWTLAMPQSFASAGGGAGPNFGYNPQQTIALGLSAVNGFPPGAAFAGGNNFNDYIPSGGNGAFVSSSSSNGGGGGGSVVSVNGHTMFYDANGNVVGGSGFPVGGGGGSGIGLANDPVNGGGSAVFSSGGGRGSSGVAVVNNNGQVSGVVYGPNGVYRPFNNRRPINPQFASGPPPPPPPQPTGLVDNGQSAASAGANAAGDNGIPNEQAPPPSDGIANDALNGGNKGSSSSSSSSSDSSGRRQVSISTHGQNAQASGGAFSSKQ